MNWHLKACIFNSKLLASNIYKYLKNKICKMQLKSCFTYFVLVSSTPIKSIQSTNGYKRQGMRSFLWMLLTAFNKHNLKNDGLLTSVILLLNILESTNLILLQNTKGTEIIVGGWGREIHLSVGKYTVLKIYLK